MQDGREEIKKNDKGIIMSEILNYAVYKINIKEIENSDDWFDSAGKLKYKEKFLYDTLLDAGVVQKDSLFVALFSSEQDAVEFCQGAGLDSNSGCFYYCLQTQSEVSLGNGKYVEIGY